MLETSLSVSQAYWNAKGAEATIDEALTWVEQFRLGKLTTATLKTELVSKLKSSGSPQIEQIIERAYQATLKLPPTDDEIKLWKGRFGNNSVGYSEIATEISSPPTGKPH